MTLELLLLAFAAFGQCAGSVIPGCRDGPSDWCSSFVRAVECNALRHCLDTATEIKRAAVPEPVTATAYSPQPTAYSPQPTAYGTPPSAVEKADYNCTDCLNLLGDLQEFNDTGKIGEMVRKKVCNKLGVFEHLCRETMDAYIDFEIMVQQLSPEDLCYLFQLCTNTNHGEFKNMADKDPRTICQTLGVCRATDDIGTRALVPLKEVTASVQLRSTEAPDQTQSSPQCVLCENVIEKMKSLLGNSTTKEEVLAALEKACNLFPESEKADCTDFVEKYGNKIA